MNIILAYIQHMFFEFKRYKTGLWIVLSGFIHLLFSYYYFKGWWYSGLGTVLIVLISYIFWKADFTAKIGLKMRISAISISIILAAFIVTASYFIMQYVNRDNGIVIQFTEYPNYIHDIFYTLNEEIILGAILLFYLSGKIKVHPMIISAGVALIFSMVHFVFYKWIFLDRGFLGLSTLSTLFFVGFFRNNLILEFRHIGYSWAFHFGWMAMMFGNHHYFAASNTPLTELERFNLYIGSWEMLVISFTMAISSAVFFSQGFSFAKLKYSKNSL